MTNVSQKAEGNFQLHRTSNVKFTVVARSSHYDWMTQISSPEWKRNLTVLVIVTVDLYSTPVLGALQRSLQLRYNKGQNQREKNGVDARVNGTKDAVKSVLVHMQEGQRHLRKGARWDGPEG